MAERTARPCSPTAEASGLNPLQMPVRIRPGARRPKLTPQESRILALLAEGLSNRQIAGQMFLSEKTVKNYVTRIYDKLGMQRRTQAAVYAIRVSNPNRYDPARHHGTGHSQAALLKVHEELSKLTQVILGGRSQTDIAKQYTHAWLALGDLGDEIELAQARTAQKAAGDG